MRQCAIVINVFVFLMTSGDDKRLKQTLFSQIFILKVSNLADNLPYLIRSQTLKAVHACQQQSKCSDLNMNGPALLVVLYLNVFLTKFMKFKAV